jgi:V/A-type H+-transporting ATPase subunit E
MKGFDKIRSAIIEEAKVEAGRILEAAKRAAQEWMDREKEKIAQEAEREFSVRVRAIDRDLDREFVLFRSEAAKKILARRNEIISEVFMNTRKEFLALPSERYEALMECLLEKASVGSVGMVRVHMEDRGVFEAIIERMNGKRPPEERIAIDESEFLEERGGFVFIAPLYEVDRRIGTLIEGLKRGMIPDVARRLFG